MRRFARTLWRGLAARLKRWAGAGCACRERRQCLRFRSAARVGWRPAVGENGAGLAAVRDVSFGGIRLITDRELPPGALLHVEVPGAVAPSRLLACVAHARHAEGGAWSVGCSFIRELSDEELRGFLGPAPSASPKAGG